MTIKPRGKLVRASELTEYVDLEVNNETVRYWIKHRNTNGFQRCLCKILSRWFIDLNQFESWIEHQQQTRLLEEAAILALRRAPCIARR